MKWLLIILVAVNLVAAGFFIKLYKNNVQVEIIITIPPKGGLDEEIEIRLLPKVFFIRQVG